MTPYTTNELTTAALGTFCWVAPIVRYVRLEGTLNIAHC